MDFHTMYQRYAVDVNRFVLYLSGDASVAEDITSEAFVRTWTAPANIRTATVKAYLFTGLEPVPPRRSAFCRLTVNGILFLCDPHLQVEGHTGPV